jgi:hypothetical protein
MRLDLLRKRHKTSTSVRTSHFQNKADRSSCAHYQQLKIKLVMQMSFKMGSCNNLSVLLSCNAQNKHSYVIGNCSVLLDRRWNWAKEIVNKSSVDGDVWPSRLGVG